MVKQLIRCKKSAQKQHKHAKTLFHTYRTVRMNILEKKWLRHKEVIHFTSGKQREKQPSSKRKKEILSKMNSVKHAIYQKMLIRVRVRVRARRQDSKKGKRNHCQNLVEIRSP